MISEKSNQVNIYIEAKVRCLLCKIPSIGVVLYVTVKNMKLDTGRDKVSSLSAH